MTPDVVLFEQHRGAMTALAYRMLGDAGRAEDVVQDAWLRWTRRRGTVQVPKAFLLKIVARLCLNELSSARARREVSRPDRLPEPIVLADDPSSLELLDNVSMAFLVVLQRLTPDERAVLLLHDVFDFTHAETAAMLKRTEAGCRQLLSRARVRVSSERRVLAVDPVEHRRLLEAFLAAAASGDVQSLEPLLSKDATLIVDAGPDGGSFGRVRNLPGPLVGAVKVAAFVAAVAPRGGPGLSIEPRVLNGQPAALILRDGRAITAILLAVADGRIHSVFMQADPARLQHLNPKPAQALSPEA